MLVVDSNRAAQQFNTVEVIHCQDGALLVLVLQEAESLRERKKVCQLSQMGQSRGPALSLGREVSSFVLLVFGAKPNLGLVY